MKRLLLAFQFLTVVPLGTGITADETDIAKSSALFVVVGFIQGILLAGTAYALGAVFGYELVIALVLMVLVLTNGGFHLDGLADTFDALAVKSAGDAAFDGEKRLAVMKDSTSGPSGVTAIVFDLGLKYLALAGIRDLSSSAFYSALLLMPVLSKWAMVVAMYRGRPARKDGLGRSFISGTGPGELALSTGLLVLVLTLSTTLFESYTSYFFYAGLLALLFLSCSIWVWYFNRKFGGLTGDTLGAIGEVTEISFLLTVIVWSRLSI